MAQPLSIENSEEISFITTRTSESRLWLISNKVLEAQILGCLARLQTVYKAEIFSFIIMGNHYHLIARFPGKNRASFMRDFNSYVALLVARHVDTHGRRSVWARRYSKQALPRDEDTENWFFYAALNPVISGLTPTIDEYHSYNSFNDAITGTERTYKWYDWTAYLLKRRYDPEISIELFAQECMLKYSRLPGYQDLSQGKYEELLRGKLEDRRKEAIAKRQAKGLGFLGVDALRMQQVGSKPKKSKTSTRYSFRPLVLTLCSVTKEAHLDTYFETRARYDEASKAFRAGDFSVKFPSGTYPPPILTPT